MVSESYTKAGPVASWIIRIVWPPEFTAQLTTPETTTRSCDAGAASNSRIVLRGAVKVGGAIDGTSRRPTISTVQALTHVRPFTVAATPARLTSSPGEGSTPPGSYGERWTSRPSWP